MIGCMHVKASRLLVNLCWGFIIGFTRKQDSQSADVFPLGSLYVV